MRCPFCDNEETQVKDSRPSEDGAVIRRRRSCPACEQRFTTFERVNLREMTVVKQGGRRQPFDRDKIMRSMQIALQKRPVDLETIDQTVSRVVRKFEKSGEADIQASDIGRAVMEELRDIDPIGYVRYASVYKDFNDLNDFLKELQSVNTGG
ncbi:MAG: transcriptional regulator NrdR [Alphaproteobacteria bacterium]|nr:transcriptional regulator NrdR [Alphaproteobacteria bacterium]HCQ71330.1 transcriptional regulator NrdR [Rhodospirillaceae bacterium]|tara:strand:+ start:40093 stop:40548 length:456 start_codon:yes stop_codon:yes gene_type:complete